MTYPKEPPISAHYHQACRPVWVHSAVAYTHDHWVCSSSTVSKTYPTSPVWDMRLTEGLKANVHLLLVVCVKYYIGYLTLLSNVNEVHFSLRQISGKTISGMFLCEIIFYLQCFLLFVCFSGLKYCNQSHACQIRAVYLVHKPITSLPAPFWLTWINVF